MTKPRRKAVSTPDHVAEQTSPDDTDIQVERLLRATMRPDALPEGYARVIQPMREYTAAEDAALHHSMQLYGCIGAVVSDQYGRIIDGNQRMRVAKDLGLTCYCTVTPVESDAQAVALATSLNMVRREYTRDQREAIARAMRDQGWSFRLIAEALRVSVNTVQRDTAVLESTPDAPITESPITESTVLKSTPDPLSTESSSAGSRSTVLESTPAPVNAEALPPAKAPKPKPLRHTRDGRQHPATRPTTPGQRSTPKGLRAGPKAEWWFNQMSADLKRWATTTARFREEGGLTIHVPQMEPRDREQLGNILRAQSKHLSDMSAHMDRILQGIETPQEGERS